MAPPLLVVSPSGLSWVCLHCLVVPLLWFCCGACPSSLSLGAVVVPCLCGPVIPCLHLVISCLSCIIGGVHHAPLVIIPLHPGFLISFIGLIPWPLSSHSLLHYCCCWCTCHCCCCCCCHHCHPPPSWSWASSWCLSSPSHCFELHPFPPHEQLLAVVVLCAEVVVVLILPLLSLSPHCCCPHSLAAVLPCSHPIAIVVPILSQSPPCCHPHQCLSALVSVSLLLSFPWCHLSVPIPIIVLPCSLSPAPSFSPCNPPCEQLLTAMVGVPLCWLLLLLLSWPWC